MRCSFLSTERFSSEITFRPGIKFHQSQPQNAAWRIGVMADKSSPRGILAPAYNHLLLLLLVFSLSVQLTAANVEKIIFLVPSSSTSDAAAIHAPIAPAIPEGGSEEAMVSLTPSKFWARAFVPFTSYLGKDGEVQTSHTPVQLDGLSAGQRYEVRVCWLASVCFV